MVEIRRRNYGIDILKLLAMYMIVILHLIGNGGILQDIEHTQSSYYVIWFLEICCYCSVNCYALISGYLGYGRKKKFSNIIYLYIQCVFYLVTYAVLFKVLFPEKVSLFTFIKALFPFAYDQYWYFNAYFGMFLIFPVFDFLLEKHNKNLIIR